MTLRCNECGLGTLSPATWEGSFRHGDGSLTVSELECHRCSCCDADPVFAEQIRRNQARVADAKRAHDGMLTGAEIRALRERLGLSQQQAAVVFGGGANAFSKYERGDVIQSAAMDRLLQLAAAIPAAFENLCLQAGFTPPMQSSVSM